MSYNSEIILAIPEIEFTVNGNGATDVVTENHTSVQDAEYLFSRWKEGDTFVTYQDVLGAIQILGDCEEAALLQNQVFRHFENVSQ